MKIITDEKSEDGGRLRRCPCDKMRAMGGDMRYEEHAKKTLVGIHASNTQLKPKNSRQSVCMRVNVRACMHVSACNLSRIGDRPDSCSFSPHLFSPSFCLRTELTKYREERKQEGEMRAGGD